MITPMLLREWNACWDDDRILDKAGGRAEVTPRDIANDDSISLDDRLWVLCRCLWYLDESAARGFAIESALLVAHLAGDEDDQAQYLGLMNRLLEIGDLPEPEMAPARAAAWDAAWDAARAAAWDAAREAARDAASAAASDAAWARARGSAGARAPAPA